MFWWCWNGYSVSYLLRTLHITDSHLVQFGKQGSSINIWSGLFDSFIPFQLKTLWRKLQTDIIMISCKQPVQDIENLTCHWIVYFFMSARKYLVVFASCSKVAMCKACFAFLSSSGLIQKLSVNIEDLPFP